MKRSLLPLIAMTLFTAATPSWSATPTTENGVTRIHLEEHDGYFSAQETITGLKAGQYEIVVTNKTNKLVGFQIQGMKKQENLDMFPLEPGQTKVSKITVGQDGFRYRCPINPTPWYEVDTIAK